MPAISIIKISKGVILGISLLLALYLSFLYKIGYLKFQWRSNSMGICGRTEYGIKYEDKIVIKITTKPDSPCL